MPGGKNIHHHAKNKGYTIIEVMIVLAVSGLMFAIAANFINGKQEKTAFPQGVNEFTAQLQDLATDVADGKYSDVPITCNNPSEVTISTDPSPVASDEQGTQGTKANCVFRGKLAHFYNQDQYEVIPLVDLRSSSNATASQNNLANINSHPDLVQEKTIPQRLEVVKATVNAATGETLVSPNNNIGFAQSLGFNATDPTGVTIVGYKSGAQTINLVFASGARSDAPIDYTNLKGNIGAAKSATICVTDGTQFATIDIGGNENGKLTFVRHMKGTLSCA